LGASDRALADHGDVDVMAQREILETQLERDRQQDLGQFLGIAGGLDQAGELQRKLVQLHRQSLRLRAASQAAGGPAAVLSRCFGPAGGSSRRLPASETVDLPQHIGRAHGIKRAPPRFNGPV
jgi:hypothetical protein